MNSMKLISERFWLRTISETSFLKKARLVFIDESRVDDNVNYRVASSL